MSRLVDEGSPLSNAWRPFEPCAESAKRAAYEQRTSQRMTLTKEAQARFDAIVDDYRTGKRGPFRTATDRVVSAAQAVRALVEPDGCVVVDEKSELVAAVDELARWHRDGR